MKKSTYIFICLLLSVNLWNLSFFARVFSADTILILTWLWAVSGFLFFKKKQTTLYQSKRPTKRLFKTKYIQYIYWIFLGVFISTFSAYFFWRQEFLTTFFAQRWTYNFMLLPALLWVQPTEKDIVKGLRWITIGTITAWVLVAINPNLRFTDLNEVSKADTALGYYVSGIQFVVLYFYFIAQRFISKFTSKDLIELSVLLIFIFLYRNRSMMLGVFPVLLYALIKFRSRYKWVLLVILSVLLVFGIVYTSSIWHELLNQSQRELNSPDYNRNLALNYYIFKYSPNWFCYIFGNGFPSGGHSPLGNLMWDNFKLGIYASDLGMIGMWADYGIIPLIAIYSVVLKLLFKEEHPLYLKFISFHILFVPTIFHFWSNPGVFFFVILFYLYAYYNERHKYLIRNAIHHHRQLQE